MVRLRIGSPVLFRQVRPGLRGEPFTMLKFRTMTDRRDADGKLLADAERLTALGRFLRRTSLDELPELLNVVAGEMSLVGPRPLLMEYLPLYSLEQVRRHDVRPGITGWTQVNGRNALTWDEKFALDVVVRRSSLVGARHEILFMTVRQVVGRPRRCCARPRDDGAVPRRPDAFGPRGVSVVNVLVIGASDQGRQVIDAIGEAGDHVVVGVLDDALANGGPSSAATRWWEPASTSEPARRQRAPKASWSRSATTRFTADGLRAVAA